MMPGIFVGQQKSEHFSPENVGSMVLPNKSININEMIFWQRAEKKERLRCGSGISVSVLRVIHECSMLAHDCVCASGGEGRDTHCEPKRFD